MRRRSEEVAARRRRQPSSNHRTSCQEQQPDWRPAGRGTGVRRLLAVSRIPLPIAQQQPRQRAATIEQSFHGRTSRRRLAAVNLAQRLASGNGVCRRVLQHVRAVKHARRRRASSYTPRPLRRRVSSNRSAPSAWRSAARRRSECSVISSSCCCSPRLSPAPPPPSPHASGRA